MKAKDLTRLGVPQGVPIQRGIEFVANYIKQGGDRSRLEEEIAAIVSNPDLFLGDPLREAFARTLYDPPYKQREALAPWKQWGSGLEPEAVASATRGDGRGLDHQLKIRTEMAFPKTDPVATEIMIPVILGQWIITCQ